MATRFCVRDISNSPVHGGNQNVFWMADIAAAQEAEKCGEAIVYENRPVRGRFPVAIWERSHD